MKRQESIDLHPAGELVAKFAGLSVAETAESLGISPRSVNREWTYARAWLYRVLKPA